MKMSLGVGGYCFGFFSNLIIPLGVCVKPYSYFVSYFATNLELKLTSSLAVVTNSQTKWVEKPENLRISQIKKLDQAIFFLHKYY